MALESARLRQLAWLGAARGPRWWARISPPPIGLLAAAISAGQRRHVLHNLRCLYGRRWAPVEYADVARTFVHFAQNLAEALRLQGNPDTLPSLRISGAHHLEQAIESGRGVVLGTVHSAGWEVALWAMGRVYRAPVVVAMQPEPDPSARAFHIVEDRSASRTVGEIGSDPLASIALLQQLRTGGVVAMQVDRCPPGMKSLEIPAGRMSWSVPIGPICLAAAAESPIIIALTHRTGFLSYDLHITPPINIHRRNPRWMQAGAERIARTLARHVYANPTQWFDFAPA